MDTCIWEEVDEGSYYEAGCNQKGFSFNDGTAKENGFKFCPFCGKPLIEKPPIYNEEDV